MGFRFQYPRLPPAPMIAVDHLISKQRCSDFGLEIDLAVWVLGDKLPNFAHNI
jgi:hypothetical protein